MIKIFRDTYKKEYKNRRLNLRKEIPIANFKLKVKKISKHCLSNNPTLTVVDLNKKIVEKVYKNKEKRSENKVESYLVIYTDRTHLILGANGVAITIVQPEELNSPFLSCQCDFCCWLRNKG